ncbi:hypothetical protein LWM68_08470 [Niabella sp. W65]|nr:hypothetical protein [Niabella sp. W65]MCH7362797.1 hypothetical protein [Niabella sp. W65]ULT38752.1 hypothetical protein KRR40_27160 [Niabella sp. I65]
MKSFYSLIIVFLLFNTVTYGQDIATDSKGKSVFSYFSTKRYRFDFSAKDFSVTLSTKPRITNYYFDTIWNGAAFTLDSTVIKQRAYYLQPSMINAADIVSLSDFSGFRPGGKLKLGYQSQVKKIFDVYKGTTYAWGVGVFVSLDNIKLFNTDKNIVEKRYPFSYGVEGNFTFFPPKSKYFVLALNTSLSRGWNDDGLLSYKDFGSAIITSQVVAFDKFDGKYGQLKTDVTRFRFAASVPVSIWYFNPTPYVVLNSVTEMPQHIMSAFITIY